MLLYKYEGTNKIFTISNKYKLITFKPKFFNLNLHLKKISLINIIWYLFTLGKYRIIYVYDDKKIIHYSYVIPKFWKFSFLSKNDLEIGPCWTDLEYRGHGIYPFVLKEVVEKFEQFNSFYMIVEENNISSIKGIEKAGFKIVGKIIKSKIMGIYNNE